MTFTRKLHFKKKIIRSIRSSTVSNSKLKGNQPSACSDTALYVTHGVSTPPGVVCVILQKNYAA